MATESTAPPAPPRSRPGIRFPVFLGLVAVLALVAPRIWQLVADVEADSLLRMKFIGQFVAVVCGALVVVWFFVSSRYSGRTRVIVLGAILLAVGVGFAAIKKVELSGSWQPILRYRWEPVPEVRQPGGDLPAIDLTIDPQRDFPAYRGRHGDGVVTSLTLESDWKAHPPRLLWRQSGGGGYAGFAVAGNVAVTIEQRHDKEAVVCYDRATGQERWVYSYPGLFQRSEPMGGDGPRATPTIADGDVYSLGALGHFACLDGQTGKARWTVNILDDNQAKNAEWAMSGSPLIVGNLVVVNPGIDPDRKAGMSLAAYDRKSGKKVWAAGNRPAGYSSPALVNLAGKQQILLFDAAGLAGFDPQDGKELWSFPWETMMGMNIVQPLVVGDDQLLISSEMSNGAVLLRVKREGEVFRAEEVWWNRKFASKFSNPVYANGHIYGLSYGILSCLDAATGKLLWKDGRYGHGQILLIGEHLLVLSEAPGEVSLVAADPSGHRELARLPVFAGKTWNTPAVAGNQLFIRTHTGMACFELPVQGK